MGDQNVETWPRGLSQWSVTTAPPHAAPGVDSASLSEQTLCAGAVAAVEAVAKGLLMVECVLKTRKGRESSQGHSPRVLSSCAGDGKGPREGAASRFCCTGMCSVCDSVQ